MQAVAEAKQVVVAQAKADCEELLVQIVQDKRAADEQERQVNAEATKIGKEAAEANAIKVQVQSELDKALPALQVRGHGRMYPVCLLVTRIMKTTCDHQ